MVAIKKRKKITCSSAALIAVLEGYVITSTGKYYIGFYRTLVGGVGLGRYMGLNIENVIHH